MGLTGRIMDLIGTSEKKFTVGNIRQWGGDSGENSVIEVGEVHAHGYVRFNYEKMCQEVWDGNAKSFIKIDYKTGIPVNYCSVCKQKKEHYFDDSNAPTFCRKCDKR